MLLSHESGSRGGEEKRKESLEVGDLLQTEVKPQQPCGLHVTIGRPFVGCPHARKLRLPCASPEALGTEFVRCPHAVKLNLAAKLASTVLTVVLSRSDSECSYRLGYLTTDIESPTSPSSTSREGREWLCLEPTCPEILEHDLLQLAQSFGVVQKVVMLRAKNQALLQMQDIPSATSVMQYYTTVQPSVRGRNVYMQFSSRRATPCTGYWASKKPASTRREASTIRRSSRIKDKVSGMVKHHEDFVNWSQSTPSMKTRAGLEVEHRC